MTTTSLRRWAGSLALAGLVALLWGSAAPAAATSYSLQILGPAPWWQGDNDPKFDSSGNVTTNGNDPTHSVSGPYTIGYKSVFQPQSHDSYDYVATYGTNGDANQPIERFPGYPDSILFQVNGKGVAVGSEVTDNQFHYDSYGQAITISPRTGASLLPTLVGSAGVAYAINDGGAIVGTSAASPEGGVAAFISDGQKALDLNGLIASGSGYLLRSATDISDAGQITGRAVKSDGSNNEYVYLLTPTSAPEPSTFALLAAASALAAIRRAARSRNMARGDG